MPLNIRKSKSILLLLFIFFVAVAIPAPAVAATSPFAVVKITSPVRRGAKARVIIKTTPAAPGTICNLVYRTPSGRVSTAKGLGKVKADPKGKCTWKWLISTNTNPGTGQLIITVNNVTKRYPIVIK